MPAKRDERREQQADLYAGPPEEFVAERNALAKRLRDDGDAEAAARVKGLKKPSVPAWAVNRAGAADPRAAARLLDAGEELAQAQSGAGGEGGGAALRSAMDAHQDAVRALMDAVIAALADAGHERPGNADRARETLRAVATDEELREEFEAGAVTRDREPVGFGSAPAPRAPKKASKGGAKAAKAAKAAKPSKEQARRAAAAERSYDAAARAADRARRRVEKAESGLEAAREELQRAQADEREAAEELRRTGPDPI